MPCSRHKSATGTPDCACFKIAMIWLSLNRDFLIALSFFEHHKSLYSKPRLFFGGITTHGQKSAFLAACDILATSADTFILTAMKGAALGAVHAMRENLIEVQGYDADDFEKGVMKLWPPKRGLDNVQLPVDALQ